MHLSDFDLTIEYIKNMTGSLGVWEHAKFNKPRLEEGLTTDDNARAFQIALRVGNKLVNQKKIYSEFLKKSVTPLGWHNDMDQYGVWLDKAGYGEWFGRGMVAMKEGMDLGDEECKKIWTQEVRKKFPVNSNRIAGQLALAGVSGMTEILKQNWMKNRTTDWEWFEDGLYYDNARLPMAMLVGNEQEIGLRTLDFLIANTWNKQLNCFSWIGHAGWWKKEMTKAVYDQQPLEAGGMVETCITAFKKSGEEKYLDWANKAWDWYFGRNIIHEQIWDEVTGGVRDGLSVDSCNLNEGAEAVLSFLIAGTALKEVS